MRENFPNANVNIGKRTPKYSKIDSRSGPIRYNYTVLY